MRPILILMSAIAAPAPASMAAQSYPAPQREVARIVSPEWSNEASRDGVGEASTVIRLIGITAGQTVADIGAGSGYYTVRLSPVVGPTGRVIAQDVMPNYLDNLKQRVRRSRLANVSFVQGTTSDPRLPPNAIDTALMIHMYHEVAQPYALLGKLRASLKPNGKLAIVDLDRASEAHGMPKALLVCEVESVGYDLVSIADLPQGYLAIFRPGKVPDPKTVKACRA